MRRQRTACNMIGLGAGSAELVISTAVEVSVALQFRAGGAVGKFLVDIVPPHIPMLLHVVVGDLIRDALVAESCDQPFEDPRGLALPHCCSDTLSVKVGANVVDQARGTGQTANSVDHPNRMINRACPVRNFGTFSAVALTMLKLCRAAPGRESHANHL